MNSMKYEVSREDIIANLRTALATWGGVVVGDANSGGFTVLNGQNRIRAAYVFTFEHIYLDVVEKPDYVTQEIIEESLRPLFEKGTTALFTSLLEEVINPEGVLEPV